MSIERKFQLLAGSVIVVAIIGTVGAIVGRRYVIVPVEAFGNAGEWTAGAAAVAALVGISIQIRADAANQSRGELAVRSSHLAERTLQAARELRLSLLHLVDDPKNGLAVRCSLDQWSEVACGVDRSLAEVLILSASVYNGNTDALQISVIEWQCLSGALTSTPPAAGVVPASSRLIADLERMAATVVV